MKQLGLGLHNYHDTFRKFPAGATTTTSFPMDGSMANIGATWLVHILPFTEEQILFSKWDKAQVMEHANNAALRGSVVSTYLCPSDPNTETKLTWTGGDFVRGCYAGNAASATFDQTPDFYSTMAAAKRGVISWQSSARMADITDGTSKTVAVWEIRSGPIATDPRGTWAMGRNGASLVMGMDGVNGGLGINDQQNGGEDIKNCDNNANAKMPCYTSSDGQACPRSMHPGGVQMLLADASVRFVAETLSTTTMQQINSAAGGETVGEY